MAYLHCVNSLGVSDCLDIVPCLIVAVNIHTCWVGEAEGVGGAMGVGGEGGVVGGLGVGGGEAGEDGIVPTGDVIVPAQAGEVAPAVADMGAVGHALCAEELYG